MKGWTEEPGERRTGARSFPVKERESMDKIDGAIETTGQGPAVQPAEPESHILTIGGHVNGKIVSLSLQDDIDFDKDAPELLLYFAKCLGQYREFQQNRKAGEVPTSIPGFQAVRALPGGLPKVPRRG